MSYCVGWTEAGVRMVATDCTQAEAVVLSAVLPESCVVYLTTVGPPLGQGVLL